MVKIKKMNVLSLAKLMTVIYFFFGLVSGFLFTMAHLFGISLPASAQTNTYGAASVIVLPILYSIVGFLSGLALAFFFNIAVKFVGGLEVEKE
ncbi:MAG: hypothetical protein HQL27_01340 [Candidatus Omnitrophica bacterium]|nr:hypothetical protein [Candidatus Omnitrophota bacterium]